MARQRETAGSREGHGTPDRVGFTPSGPPCRASLQPQALVRRLVELGLTVKTKSAPSERQRAALADLASKAIDSLTVGTAESDVKASRKRRLLKGPEEFRDVRVDRSTAKRK